MRIMSFRRSLLTTAASFVLIYDILLLWCWVYVNSDVTRIADLCLKLWDVQQILHEESKACVIYGIAIPHPEGIVQLVP